jgi:hypothetical protein
MLSLAAVCAALVFALSGARAQSAAKPYDATNLHAPVELGTMGLVQAGDDPAYARADFDDSTWIPVDAKKLPREYFPGKEPPIVWYRLHVKIAPEQSGMALETYRFSTAYEVYVNGQKLVTEGRVTPYAPYTEEAPVLASIPEAAVRTGTLTIAIRLHVQQATWSSTAPAFAPWILTLGQQSALSDRIQIAAIRGNAATWLNSLLGLGVGLVALILFSAQRRHVEYLYIFVLGFVLALETFYDCMKLAWNIPVPWELQDLPARLICIVVFLLMCQAITRRRFGWSLWAYTVVFSLVDSVADFALNLGAISNADFNFARIPYDAILVFIVPIILWRQFRRGNREAGVLLLFLICWGVQIYAEAVLAFLELIPRLRTVATSLQWVNGFHIASFNVNLIDVGYLVFWTSLAAIMVLRSTRITRHQTLLESELAAAREVQQVILPENVESVAGFRVGSVYLPAELVGGDFFQVLPAGQGGLLVIVGDVAGKGLPAAMLVSMLVGSIRTAAEDTHEPEMLLQKLNDRLMGRTQGGFSTAIAAHILADGRVLIANAGHLSPYLNGSEVELDGALPLGVASELEYGITQVYLSPGSRLTFYSDGVIEAQNTKGELFGFDRARDISMHSAAAIAEAARSFGQADDITVVTVERLEAIANAA